MAATERNAQGVDPLVVIDEADGYLAGDIQWDMREARAAVAELVEANGRMTRAIRNLLPMLGDEQRELMCDAIAEADEARADGTAALLPFQSEAES